jgi:protein-L-isoaspartate(D-aspartate) O-methyltransferase
MSGDYAELRRRMVYTQIRARGVCDPRVLSVMEKMPRHLFVPPDLAESAYADEPLPIGSGQTISQPYIVAYMSEVLGLAGDEKVLEVGTGSGYQTAVLAELAAEVWTVELVEELSEQARQRLDELGYANIHFRCGDGTKGWPEASPFDAVIVTAAPDSIPKALVEQMADGGRMVIPVGRETQELVLVERSGKAFRQTRLIGVRFVPLIAARRDS